VSLLRSNLAAPPRTLVDVFRETVADNPDGEAIDNGADVLTHLEFADGEVKVREDSPRQGRLL